MYVQDVLLRHKILSCVECPLSICPLQPLELICEKAIATCNRPLGPGEALRRVMECIASGILLPGQGSVLHSKLCLLHVYSRSLSLLIIRLQIVQLYRSLWTQVGSRGSTYMYRIYTTMQTGGPQYKSSSCLIKFNSFCVKSKSCGKLHHKLGLLWWWIREKKSSIQICTVDHGEGSTK